MKCLKVMELSNAGARIRPQVFSLERPPLSPCRPHTWQPTRTQAGASGHVCVRHGSRHQPCGDQGPFAEDIGWALSFASLLKFRWKKDKCHELIIENFKQVPQWLLSGGWSFFGGKEAESGEGSWLLQETPHPASCHSRSGNYRACSLSIPNNSPWSHMQFSFIDPRIGYFSPSIKVAEKTDRRGQMLLSGLPHNGQTAFHFVLESIPPALPTSLSSLQPTEWGEGAGILQLESWLISLSRALSTFWREASGGLGLSVEATLSWIKCPGAVEVNSGQRRLQ